MSNDYNNNVNTNAYNDTILNMEMDKETQFKLLFERRSETLELDQNTIDSLNEITELAYENRNIEYLNVETFQHLKSLAMIDLSFNQITQLDGGLFQECSSLKLKSIIANDFKC